MVQQIKEKEKKNEKQTAMRVRPLNKCKVWMYEDEEKLYFCGNNSTHIQNNVASNYKQANKQTTKAIVCSFHAIKHDLNINV